MHMPSEDATEPPSKAQSRSDTKPPCRGQCSGCSSSSWWLVVYGFFAIAFTNGCFRAITIFMPDFIVEFESSATLMGWIFSIDPFMLGVMTPFAAYSTSKFGTRPVVMVAGTFAAAGVMLLSQARHISLVGIAIGALTSTTQATVFASSALLVRRNFHLHYALAHGLVISGYSCGLFVFPPILEVLSIKYSWRGTCLIASGFMFNTVIMGALMKPPKARRCNYAPIELDAKESNERRVNESECDVKASGYTSLKNHVDANLESCNDDSKIGSKTEDGDPSLYDVKESNVDHEMEDPDLIQNGSLKANHIELSNGLTTTNATTTVEPSLASRSHQSLDLHVQSATDSKCNTDKISVSGVGYGPKKGCLHRVVTRNYHTFALYTLSMFSTTVGSSIFLLHVTISLKESGVELKDIATCLSVFAACNLIGRITNGLFVARGIPPGYMIIMAEVLASVSIIAVYMFTVLSLRVTAIVFYGLGTGVYTTLFYVFHRELVDPKVDVKTLSIFMFIEGLAGPAGGSLGGLLRDVTGNYQLTYMTSAGLSLFAAVSMVVVIFMERHRKRSSELVIEATV